MRQALREQVASHAAIIRFALVGGTGYLVYQATLLLVYDSPLIWFLPAKDTGTVILFLEHGDVRLLIATLVATPLTIVSVFTGHNLWTFHDRGPVSKPLWLRFAQFVAVASVAAFVIVTGTVNFLALEFNIYHLFALPVGVALGAIWDWAWYTQFIWRRAKKQRSVG